VTADLLDAADNEFSQNGEDGIIAEIFQRIGTSSRWCCEFGAWDGLHFSNTRRLVDQGWSALLIELDPDRYAELQSNNEGNARVVTMRRLVDTDSNDLDSLLAEAGAPELDLLVIDIDGNDYGILAGLEARPRVICIEVNAGHSPREERPVPAELAAGNIGQPLPVFVRLARERGYQLVAYSGNAFFVRTDVAEGLPSLTPATAYESFLAHLSRRERAWLYHVNRGDVPPFHRFENSWLTRERLWLGRGYIGLRFRAYSLLRSRRAGG
jgi:hypothetical protein